jgi:alkanesulfonate monooxygenase SsuD/methylene tetrahydromethanopterin reductase-like flavin-dependent oxidoreductase (luciferase family)
VILPEHRWWAAEPKWRAAEEYGFDHAWTYDHLGWRDLVDGPWFGSVPTLMAAASVTERIKLGTLVASPHFRHPVPFSRELLALDDFSDGRFLLGVGAGTVSPGAYDLTVLGDKPPTLGEQTRKFGEFVELLHLLLQTDHVNFTGEFYSAVDARTVPGCVQRPRLPFVVAANGPRTMKLAATFGQGWVTIGPGNAESNDDWWQGVGELAKRFDEAALVAGRKESSIAKYLSVDSGPQFSLESVESFTDAVGRAAELGFTDVIVHWPRADGFYAGSEAVLEAVAADVLPTLR